MPYTIDLDEVIHRQNEETTIEDELELPFLEMMMMCRF
jgi:hypothetical protein